MTAASTTRLITDDPDRSTRAHVTEFPALRVSAAAVSRVRKPIRRDDQQRQESTPGS